MCTHIRAPACRHAPLLCLSSAALLPQRLVCFCSTTREDRCVHTWLLHDCASCSLRGAESKAHSHAAAMCADIRAPACQHAPLLCLTSASEHRGNKASTKVTPAGQFTLCEMMANGNNNSRTFILSRSNTCRQTSITASGSASAAAAAQAQQQ